MSNMENSVLSNYNSLLDRNLTGYFSNTKMRKHLVKSGMIDKEGRITSENAYRMKMAKKEHRDNVRDLLASAIVDKALDMERMRRYEIRKRLEELYKIELVQKVRSERGKRGNDDLVALLTPRKGKPGGKTRKAKSAAVTKTEKIDMKLPSIHSMEKTRKFVENGDSSQSMLGGASSHHHHPPPRGSSEKKLNPHPPPGRSKKKKRNIHRGLMLAKSDQMIAHRIQLQSMAEVTMKYLGSPLNLTNDMFPANKVSEVQIIQQHCGASTICVFKELLPANTLFTFVSRRHRGSPFGLTFYIDGIQNIRLSSCCEYKHRPGHKVGGKNSQFGLVAVQGAAPCYKCQVRLNLVGGGNKGKEKEEEVYSSDEEAAVKSYDIIVSRLGRHSDSRLERPESASVMTQTAGTVDPGSGRSSGQGDETNDYQDEVFEDDSHFAEMTQRDLSSDNAVSSSSSEADSESEAEDNAEDEGLGVPEARDEEEEESSAVESSSDVPTDVPDDNNKDDDEEKDEEKTIPPQTSDNSASDSESSSDESVKSIQEKEDERDEDKQVSSATEEASETEDEKAVESVEEKDGTDNSDEDVANIETAEKDASSEEENTLSAPSSGSDSDSETKNEKDGDRNDRLSEEETEVEDGEKTEEEEEEKTSDAVVAEEPSESEVEEEDKDVKNKSAVPEESAEEEPVDIEDSESDVIPEHKDVEDDVESDDENIKEEENLNLPDIEGKGSDTESDGDMSDNRATSVISRESTMLTGNEDGEFDGVNITIKFNEEVDVVTYAKGDSTSAEETPRSDGSDGEFDSTTVSGGTVNLTSLNDDEEEDEEDRKAEEEEEDDYQEESGGVSDGKTDDDGVGSSIRNEIKKKRSEQGVEFEKRSFKDGSISSFVELWSNVAIENLYLTEKQTKELVDCLEEHRDDVFHLSLKNTIADGGIETLKPALKQLSNLQTLDLSATNIGAEECEHLVEVLLDGVNHIHNLVLRANPLEDEGANILTTALQRLPSLKTLNLSQCHLGDDAAESLFDYLSENSTLVELRLSYNRIRAEGWRYMASILGENRTLEVLRVDGNEMGDEGLELLSNGVVKNKTLCTLDVSNNRLTDDGWEVLYEATVKCPSLINLYFVENEFSQDKLQLLEKLVKMKN